MAAYCASKAGAEAGTLVLICGGAPETFEHVRPVLDAVGKKAILVGDVGAGAQTKLVGNMLIAHMLEGLGEGAALARKSAETEKFAAATAQLDEEQGQAKDDGAKDHMVKGDEAVVTASSTSGADR